MRSKAEHLCFSKIQMQLKAAKRGLGNKFVSIKPINHSRKKHFQVAKNNKYLNCQIEIQTTIYKNCQTVNKDYWILELKNKRSNLLIF